MYISVLTGLINKVDHYLQAIFRIFSCPLVSIAVVLSVIRDYLLT